MAAQTIGEYYESDKIIEKKNSFSLLPLCWTIIDSITFDIYFSYYEDVFLLE